MAAAQHTTAPTIIALAAPTPEPVPNKANKNNEVNKIVAIVTPETGLFDDPTTPAIYAATAEKRKPKTIITIANKAAIPTDTIMSKYKRKTGANKAINAIPT